jgi:hypothetical protein
VASGEIELVTSVTFDPYRLVSKVAAALLESGEPVGKWRKSSREREINVKQGETAVALFTSISFTPSNEFWYPSLM